MGFVRDGEAVGPRSRVLTKSVLLMEKNLKQKKQLKTRRGKLEACRERELRRDRIQQHRRTGHNNDNPTSTKGSTETCKHTHREGPGNWPQVEHMRTGADNHRQEVKKENTLETSDVNRDPPAQNRH